MEKGNVCVNANKKVLWQNNVSGKDYCISSVCISQSKNKHPTSVTCKLYLLEEICWWKTCDVLKRIRNKTFGYIHLSAMGRNFFTENWQFTEFVTLRHDRMRKNIQYSKHVSPLKSGGCKKSYFSKPGPATNIICSAARQPCQR